MCRVLPILFNTEMVRSILAGRKTVARRAVEDNVVGILNSPYHKEHPEVPDKVLLKRLCRAPYQIGDYLYVRETWAQVTDLFGEFPEYIYRADYTAEDAKWRPSIHMPKKAARIWLKVTDVRVERLQEIDGYGILAEGIDNGKSNPANGKRWENMQRMAFSELWDSVIKKEDIAKYGWNANPWVWAIEFERCEKPYPCILKGMEPASDKRPCIGYQKSPEDDEPCEICKECMWCDGEEPESEEL